MKYLYIIVGVILIVSCTNIDEVDDVKEETIQNNVNNISIKKNNQEQFDCFEITNKGVCGAELGESLDSALKEIKFLDKNFVFKETISNDWGFGGGSKSILIQKGKKELFVLIPSLEENKIIYIVILSPKFKLNGNITIGNSVKNILTNYPDINFTINLMTGNEESYIDSNITLVFETNETQRIGEYVEIESFSKAKIFSPKLDRIILKL